jgi:peptidyl-prolyl cis-trans isomerase B (cyclophilin B)
VLGNLYFGQRTCEVPVKLIIPALILLIVGIASIPDGAYAISVPEEDGVVYVDTIEIGRPNRIAVIDVAGWGVIKIELYENMTPITTENFIDLAESGFYDGIKFHRCINDFVAQTGDPNTKNNNPYDDGSGGSGTTIPLEINYNATHIDGAVGMARSAEPDTASSQFYICDGPQHGLDDEPRMESGNGHGYAVFGVVIEGLDVAKKIAACETYPSYRVALDDHPVDDIVMTRVTIEDGVWENGTVEEVEEKKSSDTPIPFEAAALALVIVAMIASRKRY